MIDTTIIETLSQYQSPIIFFGAFFFGETVIISASYLAAQGFWSIPEVFLFSFLGTMTSDTLWFLLGRKFYTFISSRPSYQEQQKKYEGFLKKLTGEKPFYVLLFIKFLYGTRILTLIYLSLQKVSLRNLFIYNGIGTIIWLCVIMPLGWLTQKGLTSILPSLNTVRYAVIGLIILIILYRFLFVWFNNTFLKTDKK